MHSLKMNGNEYYDVLGVMKKNNKKRLHDMMMFMCGQVLSGIGEKEKNKILA